MSKRVMFLGIILLFTASCGQAPAQLTAAPPGSSITPLVPVTSGLTATPGPTVTYLPPDCAKTAVTRAEIDSCAASNAARAEQKMMQLIAAVEGTLTGEQLDEFKNLAPRWKSLMEYLCGWEVGNLQSGTAASQVFSTCMEQQYNDRIQELKLLVCPDRGLSGPCPDSQKW